MNNIDKDIERCKELIKIEHSNWIGMSNQDAISNVLSELETYKNEIKKYKHSMAMISEICIDESKVHITTREAIEEIRKYIYHGVDMDWARKEVEKDE